MVTSVQNAPQTCLGARQPFAAAQTPSLQYWSIGHALPHAPQCFGSFFASTQVPMQARSEAPHVSVQVPAVHAVPPPQMVPQAPQCFEAV